VEQVTDQEIMDAKAFVDASGIGAEPASCCSIAGARKLVRAGIIDKKERVVAVLTGNLLKDPDVVVNYHLGRLKGIKSRYANKPIMMESSLKAVRKVLE